MKTGILLTNLGSPEEPTSEALRIYLKEFLWDKRVVDTFRPLWWLILNLIILRVRPAKSALLYEKVWTPEGSPLVSLSFQQAKALQDKLKHKNDDWVVALGMRYGQPSIKKALSELIKNGVQKIVVLPMYPQFSYTTTESTRDVVKSFFKKLPANKHIECKWIESYADHPLYIEALANSILEFWNHHGRADKILFSYHGLPQRYVKNGDPYFFDCLKTIRALVQKLGLKKSEWQMVFQSRFGREPWLKPYADEVLKGLAQNKHSVHVVCPGFPTDCLETLEEINQQYRKLYLSQGGTSFHYIPALNVRRDHIQALAELVQRNAS